MNGGYVSLDFLVYNDIIKDDDTEYHVPGAFQYASSLHSLSKPIFGCFNGRSILTVGGSSIITYTGNFVSIDDEEAVIEVIFNDVDRTLKRCIYTISTDDIVLLEIIF